MRLNSKELFVLNTLFLQTSPREDDHKIAQTVNLNDADYDLTVDSLIEKNLVEDNDRTLSVTKFGQSRVHKAMAFGMNFEKEALKGKPGYSIAMFFGAIEGMKKHNENGFNFAENADIAGKIYDAIEVLQSFIETPIENAPEDALAPAAKME